MQNLRLQIFLKSIHFIALIVESVVLDQKFHQMCPPTYRSPDYLQSISGGIDYQNSNIKKVGGINLKQICKINILAHDTGAENHKFLERKSALEGPKLDHRKTIIFLLSFPIIRRGRLKEFWHV